MLPGKHMYCRETLFSISGRSLSLFGGALGSSAMLSIAHVGLRFPGFGRGGIWTIFLPLAMSPFSGIVLVVLVSWG